MEALHGTNMQVQELFHKKSQLKKYFTNNIETYIFTIDFAIKKISDIINNYKKLMAIQKSINFNDIY